MREPAGFTLIELLVVVAIIGILAAIAVPNFQNAQELRAKIAQVHGDHSAIVSALEQYFLDQNSDPHSSHSNNGYFGSRALTTPIAYLKEVLADPFSKEYETDRGNTFDLYYEFDSGTRWEGAARDMYLLESLGPDQQDDFWSFQYPSHDQNFEFYESSNGLISGGDIVAAGGVYVPRWYRERRGGPATIGDDWI